MACEQWPDKKGSTSTTRWYNSPRRVLLLWVAFCLVLGVSGWLFGMRTVIPGPSSREALLRYHGEQLAFQAGIPPTDTLTTLLHHNEKTADSPEFRSAIASLVEMLRQKKKETSPDSLFRSVRTVGYSVFLDDQSIFVSSDKHSVLVLAQTELPVSESAKEFSHLPALFEHWLKSHPGFTLGYLSEGTGDNEIFDLINSDLDHSLIYTIPLTLLILVWAFQSFVTALFPMAIALGSLIASLGFSAFFSHLSEPVSATAAQLVVLLVLAIGIDYSLLMVTRVREELRRGQNYRSAVYIARRTTGTAIVWSGVTVACSLFGLLLMDDTILTSMAHVSIVAVLLTVASTICALPALLLVFQRFVERVPQRSHETRSLLSISLNRPILTLLGSIVLLLVLVSPLRHIVLGSTLERDILPSSMQSSRAYRMLEGFFPDYAGSNFWIVAKLPHESDADEVLDEFFSTLVLEQDVSGPIEAHYSDDRTVARFEFSTSGNGNEEKNQQLISTIRNTYIPEILEPAGIKGFVSGVLPFVTDEAARYSGRTPIVLTVVLSLSFLFLLVAFRSLAIACKAIVLNLLSAGAAFGVLTFLFQGATFEGWNYGVIESFVPALLFSILFGLSMDYHVFLLSRIQEEAGKGLSTEESVRIGINNTSRTITSAALIMTCVFVIIACLELPVMRQLGVGLALAVLLDATLIRSVLLPSSMILLGKWNWYFPKWLRWLPRLHLESEPISFPKGPGSRF
ncbi:MAG: MMPL family transporter [Bdellovibrionales bacterium]|nr:MMPL family transporter [Bdellovibrionales bacterium]